MSAGVLVPRHSDTQITASERQTGRYPIDADSDAKITAAVNQAKYGRYLQNTSMVFLVYKLCKWLIDNFNEGSEPIVQPWFKAMFPGAQAILNKPAQPAPFVWKRRGPVTQKIEPIQDASIAIRPNLSKLCAPFHITVTGTANSPKSELPHWTTDIWTMATANAETLKTLQPITITLAANFYYSFEDQFGGHILRDIANYINAGASLPDVRVARALAHKVWDSPGAEAKTGIKWKNNLINAYMGAVTETIERAKKNPGDTRQVLEDRITVVEEIPYSKEASPYKHDYDAVVHESRVEFTFAGAIAPLDAELAKVAEKLRGTINALTNNDDIKDRVNEAIRRAVQGMIDTKQNLPTRDKAHNYLGARFIWNDKQPLEIGGFTPNDKLKECNAVDAAVIFSQTTTNLELIAWNELNGLIANNYGTLITISEAFINQLVEDNMYAQPTMSQQLADAASARFEQIPGLPSDVLGLAAFANWLAQIGPINIFGTLFAGGFAYSELPPLTTKSLGLIFGLTRNMFTRPEMGWSVQRGYDRSVINGLYCKICKTLLGADRTLGLSTTLREYLNPDGIIYYRLSHDRARENYMCPTLHGSYGYLAQVVMGTGNPEYVTYYNGFGLMRQNEYDAALRQPGLMGILKVGAIPNLIVAYLLLQQLTTMVQDALKRNIPAVPLTVEEELRSIIESLRERGEDASEFESKLADDVTPIATTIEDVREQFRKDIVYYNTVGTNMTRTNLYTEQKINEKVSGLITTRKEWYESKNPALALNLTDVDGYQAIIK